MADTHEPTATGADGDREMAAFPAAAAAAEPVAAEPAAAAAEPAAAAAAAVSSAPGDNAFPAGATAGAPSQHSEGSMKTTQSFAALPRHLHALARQIRKLNAADLLHIADMTANKAHKDVFSLMQYTGSSWYLPHIRTVEEGEPEWQLKYDINVGLIVTLAGQRMELPLLSPLIRFALLVLIWFTMWNILPHNIIERKGVVFDPLILVVFSSIVGGFICRLLQIPPLVGVLWIAIMWNNIPKVGYFTSGIEKHVISISSRAGLTMILVRAGYSLTWTSLKPRWQRCLLLASLPMVLEGITHSFIANNLFKYHDNYNWAFLQGMTCSIVAPAIVVPGTLYLQELGYGKGAAPLSLMMSSVGLEIVFGVWTVNFIANLMFNLNTSLAVAIVLGPIQFLVGALLGVLIGLLFFGLTEVLKREAKPLPTGKYATEHIHGMLDLSLVFFMCLAFTMIFLGYYLSLPAGGAVMVVFFSATVAHMWIKDGDKELEEQKKYFGFRLAQLWDLIIMPYLFAMVGAGIDLKAIFNSTFFPKAIVCVVVSGAVRMIVIFALQTGSGFTLKEKLLVCIGYSGKATPQASMGSLSLNFVKANPTSPTYHLDLKRATDVKQIATLYILVYAPLAAVALVKGGKRVFKREPLLPTAAK